jgi:hypothetical protein
MRLKLFFVDVVMGEVFFKNKGHLSCKWPLLVKSKLIH